MNWVKDALLKISAVLFESDAEVLAQLQKAAARRAAAPSAKSEWVAGSSAEDGYVFNERPFYCTVSAWVPPTTSALLRPVDTTASFDPATGKFTT